MSTKNSLFTLVKNMSASEKAYFKKNMSDTPSVKLKQLLKVFSIYDKEKEYDKTSFNFKILRTGVKNVAQVKHQLYKLLLQSLLQFNKKTLSEFEIFEKLLESKLLLNKGMTEESLRALEAAEKLNHKVSVTELFPYIFIRKNYYSPYDASYTNYKLKALDAAEDKLHVLYDVVSYEKISASNIPVVINIGSVCKTKEEREHFEAVLKSELLTTHIPKSNFGKMMKQHLICFYSYLLNDIENAYHAAIRAIDLVQEPIEKADQGSLQNLSIFHYNAIQYALSTKQEEIYKFHYHQIEKIKSFIQSPQYLKRLSGELLFLELNWNLELKEYSKALELANKLVAMEEDVFMYNQSVLSEIQMKIALTYFYNSKYARSVDHINKIRNKENFNTLLEEKTLLTLLEVLCHIKLENYDLAQSLTRSLYRTLKKQDRLFQFEELLVRFIKELFNTPPNQKDRDKLGEKYLHQVQDLKAQQIENFFLDVIDLENWIKEGLVLN